MPPLAALQSKANSKVLPSLRSLTINGLDNNNKKSGNDTKVDTSEQLLYEDIRQVHKALDYFYDSQILEAEKLLADKEGVYVLLGRAFILFLKSMMTFQETDVQLTMEALKKTIHVSGTLRKKDGWMDSLSSFWHQKNTNTAIQNMTPLERHAELIYAEAYLLKALLCIIHDESVVSFVREGFNIRNSYNTYITLEKYIKFVQLEAAKGKDVTKYGLDEHFTSGVCLGIGTFNIILSLLPTSVIKVVEFIGFSVDRAHGLQVLISAGGWDDMEENKKPMNGLRRQLCDLVFTNYNVILANLVPLSHVNLPLAHHILACNLDRYPSGVFFLYIDGRRLARQGNLDQAKQQYQKAIDTQKDWKQLQHMCYWDLGLIALIQKQWQQAFDVYKLLKSESNWSQATYHYLMAVSLYMQATDEQQNIDDEKKVTLLKQVHDLMEKVPTSKKKISGKSIPLEKFVSRKARSYLRDGSLIVPDLEMLNATSGFDWMPKDILQINMKQLNTVLTRLDKDSDHYYDGLCLVNYLKALAARCLIQQDQEKDIYYKIHSDAMDVVFTQAQHAKWDHYIYYFARYENGRFLTYDGKYEQAEKEIKIVIRSNGQAHVGTGPHMKHKYSLGNPLQFKCHNCLLLIHQLVEDQQTS
ncbi:uncharacterized protein BX664DRAFT_333982 [Halteromyces radiatus]|uniref:uncharacterized protein n=1 Tax=Halteromyces radiatus TaxID=101107 RepID=UPI00221E8CCB|nr:uncharacterized protein BX664DRAFT_333982 [Halteromyces radiatus]KAI8089817.1 hypothetical protein BX664DRAFT_333982 [Halteromyces radiatus]